MKMKCPTCNKKMSHKIGKYHYTESGLDNVYLDGVEKYTCNSCGETSVTIPSIIELHDVLGRAIVNKPICLEGKEVRFLRKNMGYSSKEFADVIGVDHTTLSRWENNTQAVSTSHDRLIRLTYMSVKPTSKKEIQQFINDRFKDIKPKKKRLFDFIIPVSDWASSLCPA
jgi:putative transcriptional regulator